MIFFHRTAAAGAILSEGFRDATGTYFTNQEHTGVFISDFPVDCHEGASGDQLLMMEIPEENVLEYEWINEGDDIAGTYREFCVPAEVLNRYERPQLIDESTEDGEEFILGYYLRRAERLKELE